MLLELFLAPLKVIGAFCDGYMEARKAQWMAEGLFRHDAYPVARPTPPLRLVSPVSATGVAGGSSKPARRPKKRG